MPIKKYTIEIETDQYFSDTRDEEAIQYLIDNRDKIKADNVTPIPYEANWAYKVKAEADLTWQAYIKTLSSEDAQEQYKDIARRNIYFEYSPKDCLDCLKALCSGDSYNSFLIEGARTAFENAVIQKVEKLMKEEEKQRIF